MTEGVDLNLILSMGFKEFDSLHTSLHRNHCKDLLEQATTARLAQAPGKEFTKWFKKVQAESVPKEVKTTKTAADFHARLKDGKLR